MKIVHVLLDFLLLFILTFEFVGATCTFPSEIDGVWYSAHKGPLTFNSTHVTGYPIYMSVAVQSLDFSCLENSGDYYLLKATRTAFIFGSNIRGYLCIQLQRISKYKYYYHLGTKVDPTNNDNIKGLIDGAAVTMDMACNMETPYADGSFVTLIKDGAATSGMGEATCSSPLLASFGAVSITSASGSTCTGTTFDGCTDKTGQQYTYDSGCSSAIPFSANGDFVCLHTVQSGNTHYLSVWNNDTSIGSGDYQFTCLVISSSGSTVYATEVPNYCSDSTQTSRALPSGATKGNIYVFSSRTSSCATSVEGQSSGVFYATIIIGALTIIACLALLIFLLKTKGCPKCCCRCGKCCNCCKSNKVSSSPDGGESEAGFGQDDARPDEVANTVFRLPPMERFKPKRPIPFGPVVEASIMPLPKVEPLYPLGDNRLKRKASLGSIFSFKMKF